ncbi:ABC transporter substrate-binding protein [Bacillus horti]|uniref:Branched-chain amino acid transport system substrate-binding protein n=1 Tax=Caldalkalibacillus horti TaxID=77523 RepID=A0ABT9W1A2_9BACI|nr:ABC transporter substrate-binding protein [Bacillus horti]MDQ0167011.1 branched-chain amino acid transport system substrate-binding protein [Bacillus horti]
MKKSVAYVACFIFLLGLLAACGQSTGGGDGQSSGSGDTIKIGANLELSGEVATYGSSIAEGIDLAVEEFKAAGGINGQELVVVKVDNKSDAAETTSGALRLINQENVVAIIGAATSGNTLAQVDLANENKVVLVTPSGTNEAITVTDGEVNEYVFRTGFIDPFQGTVAANFSTNDLGAQTAALYIDNASDYSKGLAAAFKATFTENGGTIVSEEAYLANDTDFRSTLTRMNSTNPDVVYVPGYYGEVGLIVKQARELGIDVPMMGGDGWDSPALLELAGADALNNTFVTNFYSPEDPEPAIQEFVDAFEEKYNKTPNAFHALGYDTVYFLADAIERAGGTDPEQLQQAMASTADLALVTGNLTLDEKHDPIKSATILEYVDGVAKFRAKVDP